MPHRKADEGHPTEPEVFVGACSTFTLAKPEEVRPIRRRKLGFDLERIRREAAKKKAAVK